VPGWEAGFLFKRQLVCGFFEIVVLGCGVVIFRLVFFLNAWEWRVLLSVLTKFEAGGLFWLCALCSDVDFFGVFAFRTLVAVVNLVDPFRFF